MIIVTDAATSPSHHFSIGAYLCIQETDVENYLQYSIHDLVKEINKRITYCQFSTSKSTASEIQTAIIALRSINNTAESVELYTDCKSLCDLLNERKIKLQKNNFITRAGKEHANANLYKELFAITDQYQINLHKLKGHRPNKEFTTIYEKIFTILDKACRKKLRLLITQSNLMK